MTGKPWLSIIVPAYNAEKYLGDCIDSIDLEDHPDVQVILVDDGSTDSTPGVCDRLADIHKNLKAIHRENGGSPSARNAGCECAEGNWIWFVDSDDVIAPYALDALRDICASSQADAVQIRLLEFLDREKPDWPTSIRPKNAASLMPEEFLAGVYRGTYGHHMCSFLLRADALLSKNDRIAVLRSGNEHCGWPLREDFSLYEDVVTSEEFVRRAQRIDTLDFVAYGYRQVGSSLTHKKNNVAADSGLRAVLELQRYDVPASLVADKTRMELGLLFSAYKLVEDGTESKALKRHFNDEIRKCAKGLGLFGMGTQKLIRYALYRTGMMDLIIGWRLRRG